jgi:hypothetical protein
MFRSTAIILAVISTTAQADCYVRSAMTARSQVSLTSISDIQTLVVPINATQNKCFATYRAQLNGEWVTIEGTSVGAKTITEEDLCKSAMDQGRAQILNRARGRSMSVETDMVCDDRPVIQVRNVNVGELVRVSEVRPHPNFPKTFRYRAAQCRWFIEPEPRVGDLLQRQGIICQSTGDEWRVIDKW